MVSDRAFRMHQTREGYRLFDPVDLTTWQAEDLLAALDQLGRTFMQDGKRTPGVWPLSRRYANFGGHLDGMLPPGYRILRPFNVDYYPASLSEKTKALAVTKISHFRAPYEEHVRTLLISCDGYLVEEMAFGPEETITERGSATPVRFATSCVVSKAGIGLRDDLAQDLSLLPRIAGDLARLAKLWQVDPMEQRLIITRQRFETLQRACLRLGPIDRYSRHD